MQSVDASQRREQMLNEPIKRLVPKVALPSIISMLIGAIYNLADTFFVGQLGNSATGAIGVVFPVSNLLLAISFSVAHGASSLISRKLGENDALTASRAATTALYSALFLGIVTGATGMLFCTDFVRLLGATSSILPYAEAYAFYVFFGAPFFIGSNVLNNTLRAEGSAVKAMVGIGAGALLNIILDPILILALHWGTAGAGIATMIGQVFSFLLLLFFYMRKSSALSLHPKLFTPTRRMYASLLRIGMPSFFRMGLSSLALILLNNVATPYGDAAIASISIVNRITWLVSAALIGFGQGYQPISGYNYGAGNMDRVAQAYRFCLRTAILFLAVCGVILFVGAPILIRLFRDDATVIEIGSRMLRYQALVLPLQAVVMITTMLFQSIGRALPATILALSRQGICFLPLVWVLPLLWGLTGVALIQAVADVLAFFVCLPMTLLSLKRLHTAGTA